MASINRRQPQHRGGKTTGGRPPDVSMFAHEQERNRAENCSRLLLQALRKHHRPDEVITIDPRRGRQ